MDPLAAFISKNTHTLVPACPLSCEADGNSAPLRHRRGTKRHTCGTITAQMWHICGTDAVALRKDADTKRNIIDMLRTRAGTLTA
jgi:hypothetical protein